VPRAKTPRRRHIYRKRKTGELVDKAATGPMMAAHILEVARFKDEQASAAVSQRKLTTLLSRLPAGALTAWLEANTQARRRGRGRGRGAGRGGEGGRWLWEGGLMASGLEGRAVRRAAGAGAESPAGRPPATLGACRTRPRLPAPSWRAPKRRPALAVRAPPPPPPPPQAKPPERMTPEQHLKALCTAGMDREVRGFRALGVGLGILGIGDSKN
jgi:hypothetical protein